MAVDFYFKTGRPLSLIKQRATLKESSSPKPLADFWKGSENRLRAIDIISNDHLDDPI